jgi:uncharacterized protein
MDTRLVSILVCPLCKGPLQHDRVAKELICHQDKLAFPILDDIPRLLEQEARKIDAPSLS